MDGWMAWLGLDLSKNTTPPRAPSGAKNGHYKKTSESDYFAHLTIFLIGEAKLREVMEETVLPRVLPLNVNSKPFINYL